MKLNSTTVRLAEQEEPLVAVSLQLSDPSHTDAIVKCGKALSSPVRIRILNELQKRMMNYSELARLLDLPVGSIAFHIDILAAADLVTVGNLPEHKGHVRWCSYRHSGVFLELRHNAILPPPAEPAVYELGVGDYTSFDPIGEWGIANETRTLADTPSLNLYPPDRHEAQILWCHGGGVTYPFPTSLLADKSVQEINISLEIASCTLGYAKHYPSDITFSINGIELCTDLSMGDYGDRYGKLTPSTWHSESSKYGVLKSISLRKDGVSLNEVPINKKVTLDHFDWSASPTAFLRIENKASSTHFGGFNLFGDRFGDYPQSIRITVFYQPDSE